MPTLTRYEIAAYIAQYNRLERLLRDLIPALWGARVRVVGMQEIIRLRLECAGLPLVELKVDECVYLILDAANL